MALNEPRAGLRRPGVRLTNRTHSVAKVSLLVPSGSELEVDEEVAQQLLLSGAFATIGDRAGAEGGVDGAAPSAPPAPPIEEAGGGNARSRSGRRKAE